MQHIAQELILDWMVAPGSIEHFNVTNGGSGYTHATATLTGTGCSVVPDSGTNINVVIVAGAVYGLSDTGDIGKGCASVTVAISGDGTGAAATTTLTSADTDNSVGPTLMWHQIPRGGVDAFLGFGQADLSFNRIRFGAAGDSGSPYDKGAADQPTLVTAGPIEFQSATGTTFVAGERIHDASGLLSVENAAGGSAAPIKVSFARVVPTTVLGLATADASPSDGDSANVTDAVTCTFMSAVTGGGSTHCPVHYDGSSSSWKAG